MENHSFNEFTKSFEVMGEVDLTGKVALVTGANSGLGLETVTRLAAHGCEIIFGCRNQESAIVEMNKIRETSTSAKLSLLPVRLESLRSVKQFGETVVSQYRFLDYVVCNAGVFGPDFELTEDNYELTFQVNHLSHFYLLLLLKPILGRGTRILHIGSEGHRYSFVTTATVKKETFLSPITTLRYLKPVAYANSKLMNGVTTSEINRRWGEEGITANCVHPGWFVSTAIDRYSPLTKILLVLVRPFTKTIEQAVAPILWTLVTKELEGVGGKYINNCRLETPSPRFGCPEMGKSLWDVSIKMIERSVGPFSKEDLERMAGIIKEETTNDCATSNSLNTLSTFRKMYYWIVYNTCAVVAKTMAKCSLC